MGEKHIGFGYPRSVLMLAACYLRGLRFETVLQRDTRITCMVDTQDKSETPCTKDLLRLILKEQRPRKEQRAEC